MDQKQYIDITSLMEISRGYAEIIHQCMDNHGLLKDGFEFTVRITNKQYLNTSDDYLLVEIEKSISKTDHDEYKATSFVQAKCGGEWRICNDPVAEEGSVPPVVADILRKQSEIRQEFRGKAMAEGTSKPYPMDGMWISSHDDPPVLGGGR